MRGCAGLNLYHAVFPRRTSLGCDGAGSPSLAAPSTGSGPACRMVSSPAEGCRCPSRHCTNACVGGGAPAPWRLARLCCQRPLICLGGGVPSELSSAPGPPQLGGAKVGCEGSRSAVGWTLRNFRGAGESRIERLWSSVSDPEALLQGSARRYAGGASRLASLQKTSKSVSGGPGLL